MLSAVNAEKNIAKSNVPKVAQYCSWLLDRMEHLWNILKQKKKNAGHDWQSVWLGCMNKTNTPARVTFSPR